jgi:hypothetical protein
MIMRKRIVGVGGALLAFGLAAGTGAVSAQTTNHGHAIMGAHGVAGAHGFAAPLKGTIQSVGNGSFQLKTSAGSLVTVTYTSTTHVEKVVAGSTTDLTQNARVEVQFQSGSTTVVTAIVVEPAVTKPGGGATTGTSGTHPVHTHPGPGTNTGTKTGTKSGTGTNTGTKPGTGTTKKPMPGAAHPFGGGSVASFSNGTLTLNVGRGKTASYTLASNVKITKIVAGTTSDLQPNQTVQVFAPANGAAREITILG